MENVVEIKEVELFYKYLYDDTELSFEEYCKQFDGKTIKIVYG